MPSAFASCPALVRTVVVQCAAMQLPLGNAASTLISTSDASAIPEAKSPAIVSLPLMTGVRTGSSNSPSSANTKAAQCCCGASWIADQRAFELPSIEPWGDPVDGCEL